MSTTGEDAMKDEKGLLDYLTPDQQKGYVKSLAVLAEPLIKRAYEKGYKKALQDVMYEVVESMPHQNPATADWINDYIKTFAAERGIDL